MDLAWKILSLALLLSAAVSSISGQPQDAVLIDEEAPQAVPEEVSLMEPLLPPESNVETISIDVPIAPLVEQGGDVPNVEPLAAEDHVDAAIMPQKAILVSPEEVPAPEVQVEPADEVDAVPLAEEAPAAPVGEEVPAAPVGEEAPAAPVGEEAPAALVGEEVPAAPVGEEVPAAPVGEEAPAAPVGEEAPATPVGEEVPAAPVGEEILVAPLSETIVATLDDDILAPPSNNEIPTDVEIPAVPLGEQDPVPEVPVESLDPVPEVPVESLDPVPEVPVEESDPVPDVPVEKSDPVPVVPLEELDPVPVVPFSEQENSSVVSREEREEETLGELPAARGVLQERVDRTEEILPCVGRALETQTLVLDKLDAKDFVITYGKVDSFVLVDVPNLQVFDASIPSLQFELRLQFRTDLPRGLLAFLRLDTDVPEQRVHFYLYLHQGHLAARTVLGGRRQTVFSELGGLHDGNFHSVRLTTLCTNDEVGISVDDEKMVLPALGLADILSEVASLRDGQPMAAKLWLGGVDQTVMAEEQPKVSVHALHGCLQHVQLLRTSERDALSTLTEEENSDILIPTDRHNVMSGMICKDMCIESNPCPPLAKCINHYSHAVCDCSDLENEDERCGKQDFRMVRLSGGEYVSHRTQSWETRGHKKAHKASFFFKTAVTDSVLLFVRSLHPTEAYFAIGLDSEGKLRAGGTPAPQGIDLKLDQVELEFGDGPLSPRVLSDDQWHQLVVKAHKTKETIDIDPVIYFGYAPDFNQACLLPLYPGDLHCSSSEQVTETEIFYFDPSTSSCLQSPYSGCGGNANRFSSLEECQASCSVTGLPSYRPYEGCFQRVYVDEVDVLANQKTPARACREEDHTTLSFTTTRSHILVPPSSHTSRSSFFLKLQFKPMPYPRGVLAQGTVLMADTVDTWRVFSNNNSRLSFMLGDGIMTVDSSVPVNTKDWNDFSLRINNADVTLSLNGDTKLGTAPLPFTLISGLTLGGPRAALQSCVSYVEVDNVALDLRYFLDRSRGVVFDECEVMCPCGKEDACLNGGACYLTEDHQAQCDCSGTEFRGNRCQFAQYPSSCEGYAKLGYKKDGAYNIDLDGPGPRPAVPVQCSFRRRGTRTEVSHSIPEKLPVKTKNTRGHYKLVVDYDGLADEDLVSLVDSSSSCQQNVTFDCVRSQLRLSSETWFSSPRMQLNTHFGSKTPGICPCRDIDECDKSTVPCNCDLNDSIRRRDTGFIREAQELPVTAVYFVNDPESVTDKSKLQLTLGDLQCFKEAEPEDAISLLDTESFLEFPSSKAREELRSIQFAFRTSKSSAILLLKPSSHPLQVDLQLVLTSENSVELRYAQRSEQLVLKFRSPVPLNVASWQFVRIDLSQQQIKMSLNGEATKFIDLDDSFKILGGELYFGGAPTDLYGGVYDTPAEPGLIGCLKDIELNDERVSVETLLRQSPVVSYRLGCSLSCDPNRCQNGAQCNELANGQFECACRNSFAEWGERCENNLNDDSITLLDTDTEMRYKNELKPVSEEWNPLSQDLTFGFRTRQLQGLILFIIDHVQNLIQIHLSKPNEVTVLWNTGYALQVMTVNTGDLQLNRGKLVQLNLVRDAHATTLNVLSEGQLFSESLPVKVDLLEDRQYQQFPFGSEVAHPALTSYEHLPSVPSPFLRVLVGGAETENMHARVPGFIGCLSGLKIGNRVIKLTDRSVWTWSNSNYEIGCYSPCEFQNPCQNDGECLDIFLKSKGLLTECDCAGTSYVGEQCDQEIAYRFHGEEYLIFKELYNVFSQSFQLDFAFALDGDQPEQDDGSIRTVLTFRDAPDSIDEVTQKNQFGLLAFGLSQTGTVLTVVVQWPDSSVNPDGKIIEYDVADFQLSDGFRHHITASLEQRTLSIQVDGEALVMAKSTALKQENSPSEEAIVVGSSGDHQLELPEGAAAWTSFFGCISNVQVRTADRKLYRPLEDYDTHANNTDAFVRVGLPHRTQCSGFKPPYSESEGSGEVDIKLKAQASEVKMESFVPLEQEEAPYNDGSGIKTAGKIGGLIVGAVAVAVFIYLCKITHREPKTTTNEIGLIQTRPASDVEDPPEKSKEQEPLLTQSVEMKEMKSGANGKSTEVKYVKETPQKTTQTTPKSTAPEAAKTTPEVVTSEEKQQNKESPPPPASIVVEKPSDQSEPVNPEVQKARKDLDLLDPKDLEKSITKLSESCEDVSEAEQASSDAKGENKDTSASSEAADVSEAIDTALNAEENKTVDAVKEAETQEAKPSDAESNTKPKKKSKK